MAFVDRTMCILVDNLLICYHIVYQEQLQYSIQIEMSKISTYEELQGEENNEAKREKTYKKEILQLVLIILMLVSMTVLYIGIYSGKVLNIDKQRSQWKMDIQQRINSKAEKSARKLKLNIGNGQYETGYLQPQVVYFNDTKIQQQRMLQIQNITKVKQYMASHYWSQLTKQNLNKQEKQQKEKKIEKDSMFFYELHANPNNKFYQQLQYYFYDIKEGIGHKRQQLPICLIAVGRNMEKGNKYMNFSESIIRQNYTNYHIVLVDDASTDNTFFKLKQLILNSSILRSRTTLVKNVQNIGALGNKDMAIRNHCRDKDIVIDMDADDELIGSQVFKLINTLYQRKQKENWFIYSNYLNIKKKQLREGISEEIQESVWKQSNYRTSIGYWVTSELRTYLRSLYVKIPIQYMLQSQKYYYYWASDRFMMYALAQLAGPSHTSFVKYFFYFYNRTANNGRNYCGWTPMQYNEYKARIQIPLAPLYSLSYPSYGLQISNYIVPKSIIREYHNKKSAYHKCLAGGQIII